MRHHPWVHSLVLPSCLCAISWTRDAREPASSPCHHACQACQVVFGLRHIGTVLKSLKLRLYLHLLWRRTSEVCQLLHQVSLGFSAEVSVHMNLQFVLPCKTFSTSITSKRSFPCVSPHMSVQVRYSGKFCLTVGAGIRSDAVVDLKQLKIYILLNMSLILIVCNLYRFDNLHSFVAL